jgi:hypothetical protein
MKDPVRVRYFDANNSQVVCSLPKDLILSVDNNGSTPDFFRNDIINVHLFDVGIEFFLDSPKESLISCL